MLYLATAAYDAISTVALMFNLAPSEIGLALHLGAELRLFSSPLYVALTASLAALVAVADHMANHLQRMVFGATNYFFAKALNNHCDVHWLFALDLVLSTSITGVER